MKSRRRGYNFTLSAFADTNNAAAGRTRVAARDPPAASTLPRFSVDGFRIIILSQDN
jgi:hypothetical protein